MNLNLYFSLLHLRAESLLPVLVVAYAFGAYAARGYFTRALGAMQRFTQRLGAKLDRKNRNAATLVYRGMIAIIILLAPMIVAGWLLSYPLPWVKLLGYALLVLWFGHCFNTLPNFALYRRAKLDRLPLELPGLDYLFVDSHAVIRHLVSTRIDAFAIGVVGGSFWYVIGGLPSMAGYLTLAAAARAYTGTAFGWAARGLFGVMDLIPRLLACLLIRLAALFTPQTKPFASLFSGNRRRIIAGILNVSLGGPTPSGELPWVGPGTARLTYQHLRRSLNLVAVASLLLCLLLAAVNFIN